jgi:hypothetical protein
MDKGFENMALGLIDRGGIMVDDNKKQIFAEGRSLWYQYLQINGYAFRPNDEGLKKLSRNLDLNVPYLRKCINTFLEA